MLISPDSPPIPSTDSLANGPRRRNVTIATTFLRKMTVKVERRFQSSRRGRDPIPTDSRMTSAERGRRKLKKKKDPKDTITPNLNVPDNAPRIDDQCTLSGVGPAIQRTMEQDRVLNPNENFVDPGEVVVPSASNAVVDGSREVDAETAQRELNNLTDSPKAQSAPLVDINVSAKRSKRRWKTLKELKKYTRRFTSVPPVQSIQPKSRSSDESKVTEKVGDTTSSPDPHINERHASSEVQIVNQTELESDKSTPSIANDDTRFPIASTSRHNTATQHHWDADSDAVVRKEPDVPDTSKNATLQPWVNLKRATTLARMQQFVRRVVPASQSPSSSLVLNGPRLLASTPSEDNALHHVPEKSLPSVPDQGSQRKSDVRDVSEIHSRTAQESEEVRELRRELRELQKRCEAQSRDLESSNSFLNTADKSSDFDVIRALQRLNAELQQNTTYMADCLMEDFEFRNVTANELASVAQRFSKRIGHVLVNALGVGTPEEIPMLLQIAFQAYLASELCQTISSWTLRSHNNTFIAGVYESVCRSEPQAVSGRWRVVTRGHINENYITHPESLIERIIKDLSDILLITGCTRPPSDIISKITSRFREKIVSLTELAGRLNKIFDDVISSDYEVFVVQPGEKFVDNIMEDTDGGQVVFEEGQVLCATHLGLSKHVPMGTLWDQGEKERMTVLKAKVLLESVLVG